MLNHKLKEKLDLLFEIKDDFNYEGLPVTFHRNTKKDNHFDLSRMPFPSIPEEYLDFISNYGCCTLFKYDDYGA
jgi:hypothetical protein